MLSDSTIWVYIIFVELLSGFTWMLCIKINDYINRCDIRKQRSRMYNITDEKVQYDDSEFCFIGSSFLGSSDQYDNR